MNYKNIFKEIPSDLRAEVLETLVTSKNIRIERIISKGNSSPPDFWYDQDENEWIILLKGSAKLLFDDGMIIELNPGDYVNIPSNKKHRVDWTTPDEETICLAVFYNT